MGYGPGESSVEDPSSTWTVELRTRDGRKVVLARDIRYGDQAEQLVSEIRAAIGPPEVSVHRSSHTVL